MSIPTPTANDRFKERSTSGIWLGLTAAAAAHFALFAYFPTLHAEDLGGSGTRPIETVNVTPEVRMPPKPEPIRPPIEPLITSAEVDADVTMGRTTFDAQPLSEVPPPPSTSGAAAAGSFVPYTLAPRLLNGDEVRRALERLYPSILRDAGIGGTVRMRFLVGTDGRVRDARLAESSGQPQLDEVAPRVAPLMRFSPAMNRDRAVAVWIAMPLAFTPRP